MASNNMNSGLNEKTTVDGSTNGREVSQSSTETVNPDVEGIVQTPPSSPASDTCGHTASDGSVWKLLVDTTAEEARRLARARKAAWIGQATTKEALEARRARRLRIRQFGVRTAAPFKPSKTALGARLQAMVLPSASGGKKRLRIAGGSLQVIDTSQPFHFQRVGNTARGFRTTLRITGVHSGNPSITTIRRPRVDDNGM